MTSNEDSKPFTLSSYSMEKMSSISELCLAANKLKALPKWTGKLQKLRKLDLSENVMLNHLNPSVISLESLNVTGCYNLTEPPLAVCTSGFEDIKQYYKDLEQGKEEFTPLTIVLIGRQEAGKSTLLRTMQDDFKPSPKPPDVDKTEVFEFHGIDLGISQKEEQTKVIDFGGDKVYHYGYQLTCCKDCIPIVVVNMKEYEELSKSLGRREATRRVAVDWLSQLLLISPDIEQPILAITHTDRYPVNCPIYAKLKTELLETIKKVVKDLKEENESLKDFRMFPKQGREFEWRKIFEIGYGFKNCYKDNLRQLKDELVKCVKKAMHTIPTKWKTEMESITSDKCKGWLSYSDLSKGLKVPVLDSVLGYMQRAGIILWYKDSEQSGGNLGNVIFHNVEAVSKLIRSLYNHSMERKITITPSTANCQPPHRDGINSYFLSGVINKQNLIHILPSSPCEIPFDVAVALLTRFKLLYGPTTVNEVPDDVYLLPFFMPKDTFPSQSADLRLHSTLGFHGLIVPDYAFHQMTVAFMQELRSDTYQIFPYGNGASARLKRQSPHTDSEEEVDIHLIHEIVNQRVLVKVEGGVSRVEEMWNVFTRLIKELHKHVKYSMPFTIVTSDIPCPHCLFLNKTNPVPLSVDSNGGIYRKQDGITSCCDEDKLPASLLVAPGQYSFIDPVFSAFFAI